MSYEYMQGMLGLGVIPRRAGKSGLTIEEKKEAIIETCGGIGCIGVTTEPVIFGASSLEVKTQILSNMASRGCLLQCEEEDISYYCCPPREIRRESETQRLARLEAACGGQGCPEPGLSEGATARTDTLRGSRRQEALLAAGCVSSCEENGWAYFCCPGTAEIAEEEPVVEEEPPPTDVVPVDQGNGSSTGPLLFLGILGVGAAAFAVYWFLIRKEKEETEDEEETEEEEETEDEEEGEVINVLQ